MSKGPRNVPRPQKISQAAPVPRLMLEIEQENERLCNAAGKLQYQIYAYEVELKRVNDALLNLNYEAAARKELDAKAAPEADEKKEV